MSAEEEKARELMKEGEKAFRRKSVWDLVSSANRLEEALDKFNRAANMFKMAKSWASAGEAFERCADIHDQLEIPHEALADRMNAAEMYKRSDPGKAVTMFRAVAAKSCEAGRFSRAAQMMENVGELLEAESNLEGAVEAFQKAADYHLSENATSKGQKAQEKVAFLQGMLGQYDRAAQTFEALGTASLDSSLLKFGAKKHFLHAGICLLARGDVVAARLAHDRFCQLDLSFPPSREAQLLKNVADAYDAFDGDAFSQAVFDYDSVNTLTAWETSILLRVKNTITEVTEKEPDLR